MFNNTTSIFKPETVLVPVVFSLIFIVGLIGNGLLLYFVTRFKILQTVPNILITNLAVGDILLLIVCVPFTSTIYTFKEWPYGEPVCKINEFLKTISIGVSIFTLTALSAERHNVLTSYHRSYNAKTSRRRVSMTIAGIWLLAVSLAIPDVMSSHTRVHENSTISICDLHHPSFGQWYPKIHAVIRFVALFAAPVVIITTYYVLLSIHLMKMKPNTRIVKISNGGSVNADLVTDDDSTEITVTDAVTHRKRVAQVVLCLSAMFIICWLPYHIYNLWYFFDPGLYNLFWHIFKITGFCLAFLNSCVNPFVMYYLDRRFRSSFNKLLFCCCHNGEAVRSDEISLDNINDKTTFPCLTETVIKTDANEPVYL